MNAVTFVYIVARMLILPLALVVVAAFIFAPIYLHSLPGSPSWTMLWLWSFIYSAGSLILLGVASAVFLLVDHAAEISEATRSTAQELRQKRWQNEAR